MRSLLVWGMYLLVLAESKMEARSFGSIIDCEHGFTKVNKKLLKGLLGGRFSHRRPVHSHPKADSCDAFVGSSEDIRHRSLSPWRTKEVEKQDMYPSKYVEAECLCDGCIINGVEDRTYNSVPVLRKQLFLKKGLCPNQQKKYYLIYELVEVPVSCTCVVPTSRLDE